eukprot:66238-Hanusia_phi.AAC.1
MLLIQEDLVLFSLFSRILSRTRLNRYRRSTPDGPRLVTVTTVSGPAALSRSSRQPGGARPGPPGQRTCQVACQAEELESSSSRARYRFGPYRT